MVDNSSWTEIDKVNAELVEKAVSRLKNNKTDPQYDFTTDCIKNSPVKNGCEILFVACGVFFCMYIGVLTMVKRDTRS